MTNKKTIALELLAPYFKDTNNCAHVERRCLYETPEGKRCVAGSAMLNTINLTPLSEIRADVASILKDTPQSDVFLPQYVDVFTTDEWRNLQQIHDGIVDYKLTKTNEPLYEYMEGGVNSTGLFTINEMINFLKLEYENKRNKRNTQ